MLLGQRVLLARLKEQEALLISCNDVPEATAMAVTNRARIGSTDLSSDIGMIYKPLLRTAAQVQVFSGGCLASNPIVAT